MPREPTARIPNIATSIQNAPEGRTSSPPPHPAMVPVRMPFTARTPNKRAKTSGIAAMRRFPSTLGAMLPRAPTGLASSTQRSSLGPSPRSFGSDRLVAPGSALYRARTRGLPPPGSRRLAPRAYPRAVRRVPLDDHAGRARRCAVPRMPRDPRRAILRVRAAPRSEPVIHAVPVRELRDAHRGVVKRLRPNTSTVPPRRGSRLRWSQARPVRA